MEAAGLFHPTAVVDDLREAGRAHQRLFGVESAEVPYAGASFQRYATFAQVADVPVEVTEPNRAYASLKRQFLRLVGPHWSTCVLYVDDMDECIRHLREGLGLRLTDPDGSPVDEPAPATQPVRAVYTDPAQTGIDFGLLSVDPDFAATDRWWTLMDPRRSGGWAPAEPPARSVGAVRHSQHVLVTDDARPAVDFLVGALDGRVFAEEANTTLGTKSTFVSVGRDRTTFEVAIPQEDGPARHDLQRNGPIYHTLTFQVADLDRAIRHLEQIEVRVEVTGPGMVVTDPADCAGLRYGFVSELPSADPRSAE